MGFFSKFIISLFVGLIGIIVIFLTFFQSTSVQVDDIFTQKELSFSGKTSVITQKKGYSESLELSSSGSFFLERFSHLDSLYSSPESSYTVSGDTIMLNTGMYVLDFRDVTKNHIFSGSGFTANIFGEGRVFVDMRKEDSIHMISQSATVQLQLLDTSGNNMTQMFLYPHMSFVFHPSRNQFVQKGDIVRLTSIHTMSYVSESFQVGNTENILSKYFLDTSFFSDVWLHIQYLQNAAADTIEDIGKIHTFYFPGQSYIEKYYFLFVNEEKQKAYYKNKYLGALVALLKDPESQEKNITLSEASELLSLFPEEQDDLQRIVKNLQFYYSYSYDETSLYIKKKLSELGNLSQSQKNIYGSSLTLSSLYNNFDISGVYLYSFLEKYFSLYLSELGIDIKNQETLTLNNKFYVDYFLFFLERVFLSGIEQNSSGEAEQGKNIFNIFSQYSEISPPFYNLGDTKRKLTGLYIYGDILSSFDEYILHSFFEAERGKNNILVRKKNTIDFQGLAKLRSSMTLLFDYYKKNKIFLDPKIERDALIGKNLDILEKKFMEYFSALENYDSYVFNYDEMKKNLLSLEVGDGSLQTFDESSIMKYLSQFEGLSLSDASIIISEGSSYAEVKNIIINSSSLSFRIFPLKANFIDSIVIDGKNVNSSYKLDIKQSEWEEKLKNASDQDRLKYTFAYFFINTFFSNNTANPELFDSAYTVFDGDIATDVFKKRFLIGDSSYSDRGEFAPLASILPLTYNSIDLTENGEIYDIFLKETPLTLSFDDGKSSVQYVFSFFSSYKLDEKHHEFFNIQLFPYRDFNNDKTFFNLGGTPILISGPLVLKDFQTKMQDFISDYTYFYKFYTLLETKFSLENKKIEYILGEDIFVMNGLLGKKPVQIYLQKDSITSLKVMNKEKIKTPLSGDNISEISRLLLTK